MQLQKDEYELNIIYFFLNIRKRSKRNHFSSEGKHLGNLKKATPAPQQLSSAICEEARGKGMASFQRKLELNCPARAG